jgi:hypothetical protein
MGAVQGAPSSRQAASRWAAERCDFWRLLIGTACAVGLLAALGPESGFAVMR